MIIKDQYVKRSTSSWQCGKESAHGGLWWPFFRPGGYSNNGDVEFWSSGLELRSDWHHEVAMSDVTVFFWTIVSSAQAHFMWLDWLMGCARWRRLSKSFSRWCSYHSAVTSMDCRRMSDDCWICALVVPILFVQQTHSSSLFKTKQIMLIFFCVFFELRELSASQGLLERSGNGVNFKARNQMLVASSWISQERASCEASEQDLLDWLEGNVVDGTPKPLKRIGRHRLIEAFKERQSAQNSESTWTERSTIHSARNILLSA